MITGRIRFREALFGKMILQVEDAVHLDGMDPSDLKISNIWRDATIDDVSILKIESKVHTLGSGVRVV